jgi:hypothetical protein
MSGATQLNVWRSGGMSFWRSGMRAALVCMVVMLAGVPASAAEEPTVAGVWAAVRSHYTTTPTIERLRVSVRSGDGPTVRQTLSVRTEPGLQTSNGQRLWVRAGVLKVELGKNDSGGQVRVALEREQSAWAELEGDDPLVLLRRAVPPLPVPHADLLFASAGPTGDGESQPAEEPRIDSLTPYARRVTWDELRVERRSAVAPLTGTPVTLVGRHDGGRIELLAEAETGRMRRVVITRSDAGGVSHELTIEIYSSAEPASVFEIDLKADRRRDNVASVVLEGRSIDRPETRFDFAWAVDLDGLPMVQPTHTAEGRASPRPCIVAAVEWDGASGVADAAGAERMDEAKQWLRAVRSAIGELGGDRDLPDGPALVVLARKNSSALALTDSVEDRADAERLRSLVRDAGPDAVATSGWHRVLDWPDWAGADGAPLVVVLVDAKGNAVGVIPSSWGPSDFADTRREVREAMSELLVGTDPETER